MITMVKRIYFVVNLLLFLGNCSTSLVAVCRDVLGGVADASLHTVVFVWPCLVVDGGIFFSLL